MAFSLNKVMLIGNLGNDAEHRFTTNNTAISTFSIATTESYKDKSGNWNNTTTWHNCKAWKLPDFYKEHLLKGVKIYVEGKISKSDYTDKEGIKRYSTDVIVEKIIFLDKKEQPNTDVTANTEIVNSSSEGDDDLPF